MRGEERPGQAGPKGGLPGRAGAARGWASDGQAQRKHWPQPSWGQELRPRARAWQGLYPTPWPCAQTGSTVEASTPLSSSQMPGLIPFRLCDLGGVLSLTQPHCSCVHRGTMENCPHRVTMRKEGKMLRGAWLRNSRRGEQEPSHQHSQGTRAMGGHCHGAPKEAALGTGTLAPPALDPTGTISSRVSPADSMAIRIS